MAGSSEQGCRCYCYAAKIIRGCDINGSFCSFAYIYLMDTVWIILGFVLIFAGLIGSVLPILPGPPVAYAGLLIQLFREPDPFTAKFLWIMAGVVVVSMVLDWLIPI